MKTLLHIDTSIRSGRGASSLLARAFVDDWRAANPQARIIQRDLALDPVPHLSEQGFLGFLAEPEERSAEQQSVAALSDTLIDELRRADEIALGLPMYNFGVPSTLKAYFDHIARAGVTFRYTETGPIGLLTGKTAYVFAARGGIYQGTPVDTQTPYIRNFLGLLGIEEIRFVYAEGLALGETPKQRSLAHAYAQIEALNPAAMAAA